MTVSEIQVNGHAPLTNGHVAKHDKENLNGETFQHLPAVQQEVLLLHGPRQRYTLETSGQLPEVRGEREILVQVLAVGLNPIDWKGPEYNFGLPSFPWINGRDFAGIVVKAGKGVSRIKLGDVVFGPSTDYRDPRKACYQEYLITTDFNVARLPTGLSVNAAAGLGVAFISAVISLGITIGLDFSVAEGRSQGPDLLQEVRKFASEVPEDVRGESLNGIAEEERPRKGEWIVIWGGSTNTGIAAIQIAKLAGLRVIAVADLSKHLRKLIELGVDVPVDRNDPERAVDIISNIADNELRFGLDTVGKDSAALLQQALNQSRGNHRAHLIGLTGLPKEKLDGINHHTVPIKVFHSVAGVGEAISNWLERLLVEKKLKTPDIVVANGGLAGINGALDDLKSNKISGKRIVVPLDKEKSSGLLAGPNGDSKSQDELKSLKHAEKLNGDPDRIRFAYWVPNVSGGLVISKIKQETSWDLDSNIDYARSAERHGFEYALTQIRFMAGYGAENQHESVSFSQALLHNTERLRVIAALLPGPWPPSVAAKMIASVDHYSKGRIAVNVVSGWFKAEFHSIGQWWLDHAERYRRSREFIQCLKGIWTQDSFSFKGDFYQFHEYPLKPKPLILPDRPWPEIFQGGNSLDARENAAIASDYYFMNGNDLEGFQEQIRDVKKRAEGHGRAGKVKFAVNAFVIARETEAEAIRVLQEIQGKADHDAVEAFRVQVQNAGASTSNKTGMWASSDFRDLIQYNDGFKSRLIGTPEQIADRILLLKALGVDILLVAFLHYRQDIRQFGEQVIERVRKLEAEGRGKDEAYEISLTGDVYRANKPESG